MDLEPLQKGVASFVMGKRHLGRVDSHDPFLLKDMDKAVDLLLETIAKGKRIFIHGDYDVDGLTASSILLDYLADFPIELYPYIPNRLDEGYGLKTQGVEEAINWQADLLITVDCGINSVEEVAMLREAGIDVIVTDHHEVGEILPPANAVINPHRADDNYPFKDLAGAGVAYKLVQALGEKGGLRPGPKPCAYAALGTIADIMPVLGENRLIIQRGIEAIKEGALPAVSLLFEASAGGEEEISALSLSYKLIPKLNAAGRMGRIDPALNLLISRDPSQYESLVQELLGLNKARQDEEKKVLDEALTMVRENPQLLDDRVLFLRKRDWHPGVLGIVSSRLRQSFQKPTVLFSEATEKEAKEGQILWKGSGRSADHFNLYESLAQGQELLESFGGHSQACGLAVLDENWQVYKDKVNSGPELWDSRKEEAFDAVLSPLALNLDEVKALSILEPFGKANTEPNFVFKDMPLSLVQAVGQDKTHLRLGFSVGGETYYGIGFSLAPYAEFLKPGDHVTVLGKLQINSWQGQDSPQIMMEDLLVPGEEKTAILLGRPDSEEDLEKAEDSAREALRADDVVAFWKTLSPFLSEESSLVSLKRLKRILEQVRSRTYSLDQVEAMLEIFVDAGLLSHPGPVGPDCVLLNILIPQNKVKLSDTPSWQVLVEKGDLLL